MGLSNIWDRDKGTVTWRGIGYIGTGTKVKNEKNRDRKTRTNFDSYQCRITKQNEFVLPSLHKR